MNYITANQFKTLQKIAAKINDYIAGRPTQEIAPQFVAMVSEGQCRESIATFVGDTHEQTIAKVAAWCRRNWHTSPEEDAATVDLYFQDHTDVLVWGVIPTTRNWATFKRADAYKHEGESGVSYCLEILSWRPFDWHSEEALHGDLRAANLLLAHSGLPGALVTNTGYNNDGSLHTVTYAGM